MSLYCSLLRLTELEVSRFCDETPSNRAHRLEQTREADEAWSFWLEAGAWISIGVVAVIAFTAIIMALCDDQFYHSAPTRVGVSRPTVFQRHGRTLVPVQDSPGVLPPAHNSARARLRTPREPAVALQVDDNR